MIAQPLWILLLPLPILFWVLRSRGKLHFIFQYKAPQSQQAILHPQADLIADLIKARTTRHTPWLWLAGCAFIILAIARPQWWDFNHPSIRQGYDLMLAIDISGSMRAQDFNVQEKPVSRIDLLKKSVKQFISQRPNDRIGIILFADDALTFTPMSTDRALLDTFIDDIRTGLAGEKTALGEAVALAVERLQEMPSDSRLLILLTDGTNTAGSISPTTASRLAQQQAVRIFTVGIGSDDKVLFPRGPIEQAEIVTLPLNETLLRQLAADTSGQYFRASNPADMERILEEINRLVPSTIRDPAHAYKQEWYWLPLLIGLILLVLAESRLQTRALP